MAASAIAGRRKVVCRVTGMRRILLAIGCVAATRVNMGMHHFTRAEDLPVMPTIWHSFKLRPHNFFNRNPAIDLRKDEPRQEMDLSLEPRR